MENAHKLKVESMKTEVMDIKAGFDQRVIEFKQQINDFRKNNEAIDALKKAHAKELAAHVQEHNKKYTELLTEKLNSEDALRQQFDQDRKALIKEWQTKLNDTVQKARAEEQAAAKDKLERVVNDYSNQICDLQD